LAPPLGRGGGQPFAALTVGSRAVVNQKTLAAITKRFLEDVDVLLSMPNIAVATHFWREGGTDDVKPTASDP
jgi:hypothetical protein